MNVQPTISLSTPADIVSAVPALLGYIPEDSVVVIHLNERRLGCVARCNVSDLLDEGRQINLVVQEQVLDRVSVREDVSQVILLGYGSGANLAATMGPLSVPAFETIIVKDGWWAALCDCDDRTGCEGLVDPAGRAALEIVAATGTDGNLTSRQEFEQRHEPEPIPVPKVFQPSEGRVREAWQSILQGTWNATDLGVVKGFDDTGDRMARDSVVAWFGVLELESLPQAWAQWVTDLPAVEKRVVLHSLLTAAKASNTALLWAIYAHAQWANGEGAAANLAITHGLRADRDYRLLLLLAQMVQFSIRPKATEPRWAA
jgi:hypothetical protein